MDVLQTWIVVGVPGLVIAGALLVGRSRTRALLGYAALGALVLVFATTPGGGASAVAVGLIAAVVLATGRGTSIEAGRAEHHQQRERFTRAQG